ncbi:MAG TPA: MAPEG family protein [Gammaproteobacteria bacterium]|jgi:uncharacterized membrane protein YecN with MAPEG domain|nr:MAPEG family protein [Gammaproteobacteria bacterium]
MPQNAALHLTHTLITAGMLGVLYAFLAATVIRSRIRNRVSLGDGGHPELLARIRAHGNFGEYVPFLLILMGLVELAGGSPTFLTWSGVALVVLRVLQAVGVWKRVAPQPLRIAGTAGTLFLLVYYSVWAIVIGYHHV